MVTAVGLNPLFGVYAQSNPPSPKECSDLIHQASDDNSRRSMTKEQLDRTTACLDLLKTNKTPDTSSAPIKIFRKDF